MDDVSTHYDVLEIRETASPPEIRTAYRRLAHEYHPDKVPEHLTRLHHEAGERFKQINEAYKILIDSTTRAQYDALLRTFRQQTARKDTAPASSSPQPSQPRPSPHATPAPAPPHHARSASMAHSAHVNPSNALSLPIGLMLGRAVAIPALLWFACLLTAFSRGNWRPRQIATQRVLTVSCCRDVFGPPGCQSGIKLNNVCYEIGRQLDIAAETADTVCLSAKNDRQECYQRRELNKYVHYDVRPIYDSTDVFSVASHPFLLLGLPISLILAAIAMLRTPEQIRAGIAVSFAVYVLTHVMVGVLSSTGTMATSPLASPSTEPSPLSATPPPRDARVLAVGHLRAETGKTYPLFSDSTDCGSGVQRQPSKELTIGTTLAVLEVTGLLEGVDCTLALPHAKVRTIDGSTGYLCGIESLEATPHDDLGAFALINTALRCNYDGHPEAPVEEAGVFENFIHQYPDSKLAPRARMEAASRYAEAADMYEDHVPAEESSEAGTLRSRALLELSQVARGTPTKWSDEATKRITVLNLVTRGAKALQAGELVEPESGAFALARVTLATETGAHAGRRLQDRAIVALARVVDQLRNQRRFAEAAKLIDQALAEAQGRSELLQLQRDETHAGEDSQSAVDATSASRSSSEVFAAPPPNVTDGARSTRMAGAEGRTASLRRAGMHALQSGRYEDAFQSWDSILEEGDPVEFSVCRERFLAECNGGKLVLSNTQITFIDDKGKVLFVTLPTDTLAGGTEWHTKTWAFPGMVKENRPFVRFRLTISGHTHSFVFMATTPYRPTNPPTFDEPGPHQQEAVANYLARSISALASRKAVILTGRPL